MRARNRANSVDQQAPLSRPVGTTDVRRGFQPPFQRYFTIVSRSDTSSAIRARTTFNRRYATSSRARHVRGINPTANINRPYGTGPARPIAKMRILGRATPWAIMQQPFRLPRPSSLVIPHCRTPPPPVRRPISRLAASRIHIRRAVASR